MRGFRNALLSLIPRWLSNRPLLNTGFKILYTVALQADIITEVGILEAIRSWMPGYPAPIGQELDASTALPYIGRSRGILRGESETDATYATRLRAWLDDWTDAGSSEVLVQQIQAYLGNTPTVRIVDRSGFWVSIDPSGNITTAQAAWNWDSLSNAERAGWWSDLWIIVYPCEWPITGTTLASLAPIWGTYGGAELGTGHAVPRSAVATILSLVAQWKAAHCFVQAILWSYDATLFVPGSPGSGDPDGWWGNWSKVVAGVQVPARLADGRVRFWIPDGG